EEEFWLSTLFCPIDALQESELLSLSNSSQIFQTLSNAPGSISDINEVIKVAYSLNEEHLESASLSSLRRHYLAQLMVEETAVLKPDLRPNLPKQYLAKRQLKRPRSRFSNLLQSVLWSTAPQRRITGMSVPFRTALGTQTADTVDEDDAQIDLTLADDPKLKNVRQTEILMDLKQSIAQIVRHFRQTDPQHSNATMQADYSMESHGLDLETYVQNIRFRHCCCFSSHLVKVAQHRRQRAKALLDFARHEPDELGFRKNDIITVVSSEDEHCWVGELNGSRGWFPAKFVELLDERGKNYSPAGDDGVDRRIIQLVRGYFCSALGAVFTHGLKRPRLLGESGCHPWHFIEEAAAKEVERDFNSVYSRLVLCKTFRLDEEGKVLSPEEVLYRAIHTINMSHDLVSAHMDVKFRSLVCYGLNEQLLHMWLETLCSSVKVIEKWYHPWSYLRSPGWVQIKCELRVLSQFAFHLSPNYELDLEGASFVLLNPKDRSGSNRSRRLKSSLIGTMTSNALSDVNHVKPLRRLTRAASTVDPMNDPPSLARSFPAVANPVAQFSSPSEEGTLNSRFSEFTSSTIAATATASRLATENTGDMLIKYHLFSWEL
ncbi:Small G protein signaling modulator 3 protein, partial [Fasciolopsis buskii]